MLTHISHLPLITDSGRRDARRKFAHEHYHSTAESENEQTYMPIQCTPVNLDHSPEQERKKQGALTLRFARNRLQAVAKADHQSGTRRVTRGELFLAQLLPLQSAHVNFSELRGNPKIKHQRPRYLLFLERQAEKSALRHSWCPQWEEIEDNFKERSEQLENNDDSESERDVGRAEKWRIECEIWRLSWGTVRHSGLCRDAVKSKWKRRTGVSLGTTRGRLKALYIAAEEVRLGYSVSQRGRLWRSRSMSMGATNEASEAERDYESGDEMD